MNRIVLVVAALVASTSSVFAADLDYAPPAAPAPPDMVGLVFRLVGLTVGLLVLCGGVLYFARRVMRPKELKGGNGRLQHEGSLVLDRRCAVHLIRADGLTIAVTTDATGLGSMVLLSEPFEDTLEAEVRNTASGVSESHPGE